MHVHVEDARLLPEEVIVNGRHVQAVVEQRRHDRVDLVLCEHQIAHHDVHAAGTLGHGHPPAEAERGRCYRVGDGDAEIAPRDVDLEHIGFEVALLAECREHLLVLCRNILRLHRRPQRE